MNKIITSFDKFILELETEMATISQQSRKWSMLELRPDFEISELSNQEIRDFQLDNAIKIKHGNNYRWNPEYKKEVLNHIYLQEVLPFVFTQANRLKKDFLNEMDSVDISELNQFLKKKIKHHHNLKDSDDGNIYYDLTYSNNTYLHVKDRFDLIWHINERKAFIPENEREDNPFRLDEYPFLLINLFQWLNFEAAYRIIPLLKNLVEIINNDNSTKQKALKKTTLKEDFSFENIITINRYPLVFKDARSCEFFFFVVHTLKPKTNSDYSHYYLVFERLKLLKTKGIRPKYYWDFLMIEFGLPPLRFRELGPDKEGKLINDCKYLLEEFDRETAIKFST